MSRGLSSRPLGALVSCAVLALVTSVVGCGPATPALRPLPAYSGRMAALFDDGIDATAVGLTGDRKAYQPKYDPDFRERAQTADGVVLVKVTTVSAKAESSGTSYVLGCHIEKKLAGAHAPPDTFELQVASSAPSAGILKNLDAKIVGMKFVAFVRAFVRPDGDPEIHFHFSAGTKDLAEASTDATTILEAK
jgi:hypothetical protein